MRQPAALICFLALISLGVAQSADGQRPGNSTFDVASVKPSPPIRPGDRVYFGPPRGGPGTPDPGRITWRYATLKNLLMTAYAVESYQVTGPDWLATERYDIEATVPPGATKDQVNIMWQTLLAERFGVVLHRVPKEFQVEELVIGKNGPKLKESLEDLNTPPPDGPPVLKENGELAGPGLVTTIMPGRRGATAHSIAKAQPLSKLTAMLTNGLRRPVLDRTGLTGKYDFTLDFVLDASVLAPAPGVGPPPAPANPADAGDPGPDLEAAVQQQLGLRLVKGKATLDVLVVDKAARVPSEN